jgi:hypothetical protein
MIDKNRQRQMAEHNGALEELYVQEVRDGVSEIYESEDELAIHRKAIAYLFEQFATLHAGEIDNAEFAKYNAEIEAIKSGIKSNLGMK